MGRISDFLLLAGALLIVAGIAMYSKPAGLIAAGMLTIAGGAVIGMDVLRGGRK